MTKGNWEKDGYMTLEASFIMPITVILITALMYLSFYLYTIAFLNQAAYIAAFRASLCDEGNAEAEAAAARELSRYKGRICVLEKEEDVCCGTSKANSAIVHAGYDAKEGTLKAKLNVRGAKMMGSLCADLSVPFQNIGSLVLAFSEEEMETLRGLLAVS